MQKTTKKYDLAIGICLSALLHFLLLAFIIKGSIFAPEPGGSGLVMDAYLTGNGNGFYQKGVPWGDKKATKNPVVIKETPEKKALPQKKKSSKKAGDITGFQKTKKTSSSSVKNKPIAKQTFGGHKNATGTNNLPYGGIVGDAAGFGAGQGTGIGIGTGKGIGNVKLARYFVRLRRLFQNRLRYPKELQNQKVSGRVLMRFQIQQDGVIVPESVKIIKSSGHQALDNQAIKIIKNEKKIPKPPLKSMTIEIPIVFQVYH